MSRTVDSHQLAVFERLIDIGKLLERRADRIGKRAAALKFAQYEILVRLRNAGGSLRMLELVEKLVSTPSRLSYQVAVLERAGLVQRSTATEDERGVVTSITESGRALLLSMSGPQGDMILEAVADPLTDEEVRTLHALLGKLQVNLRGAATGGELPHSVKATAGEG